MSLEQLEKMEKMSYDELSSYLVFDYDVCQLLNKKHKQDLEERSDKLAKEKEEKLFLAHKEEFQREVLEQLQREGVNKEGMELSSASPLISDTYFIDGVEVLTCDFIPDMISTDGLYEDNSFVKNQCCLEYQEVNNKTGKPLSPHRSPHRVHRLPVRPLPWDMCRGSPLSPWGRYSHLRGLSYP